MQKYTKHRMRELKLDGSAGIRINKAGCMGRCKKGPVLVVYPDEVWYHYEVQADIDEIIDQHLLQGKIVKRLLLI